MKYFVYHCEDIDNREEAARIRKEYLQAHLDYVVEQLACYAVAGPNRHGDGEYHSSTFILQAESQAAADAIMENDPYVMAGLYGHFAGVEFVAAAGRWVGGTSWG